MDLGYGCHLFTGRSCSKQFPKEHYRDVRNMCAELDHEALDFVIMGALMTNTTTSNSVNRRGHLPQNRQSFNSLPPSRTTGIGQYYLTYIQRIVMLHGTIRVYMVLY